MINIFAGPGKEIYTKGAGGAKGHDGGEEKLYCQVCMWDYYRNLWCYELRIVVSFVGQRVLNSLRVCMHVQKCCELSRCNRTCLSLRILLCTHIQGLLLYA